MSMGFEREQDAYEDVIEQDDATPDNYASEDDTLANAEDEFDDSEFDDAPIFSSNSGVDDFIGESSIVFDVDDLVAQFEAESEAGSSPSARLRKRLEALAERKRRHAELLDFNDYELD